MDERKPRKIRDIAHLYLSRLDRASAADGKLILTAGSERECFPAFHTVNTALAFSSRGYRVDLVDLSEEPLGAGFFLSLPPAVYLEAVPGGAPVSAVGQITLSLSLDGPADPGRAGRSGASRIRIVHLPPFATGGAFGRALDRALTGVVPPVPILYFAGGPHPDLPERDDVEVFVVGVGADAMAPPGAGTTGRIDRWQGSLCDPIPPVLRDPLSTLARAYHSLCEALAPVLTRAHRSSGEKNTTARRVVRPYRGRGDAATGPR